MQIPDCMVISYEIFLLFCPSAQLPDDSVFRAVFPFISGRLEYMERFLGRSLYDRFSALDYDFITPPADGVESAALAVARYASVSAYLRAVPQLDLVITANGFGVVSNSNVAPASSERVKRLIDSLRRAESESVDSLLDALRHFPDWNASPAACSSFSSLFWKSAHAELFGVANPLRSDLVRLRPKISSGETALKRLISPAQTEAVLTAVRTAAVSPAMERLVSLCRAFIVDFADERHTRPASRDALLSFLDGNLSEFPAYASSSAYKANHFKPYENKEDDPCFFFG